VGSQECCLRYHVIGRSASHSSREAKKHCAFCQLRQARVEDWVSQASAGLGSGTQLQCLRTLRTGEDVELEYLRGDR
jgi:hypothetical protein